MLELLFLLLPVAAFSGWYIGQKTQRNKNKKNKDLLPSQYFSGMNYLLNEQPDKAVDIFMQMIEIDDEIIETHLLLGSLFRKRGEVDRAIKIHQSLMTKPNLSLERRGVCQLELAKDYISAGVLNRAEELLQDLIEQDQQVITSLEYLIDIYQQAKDWHRARNVAVHLQAASGKCYRNRIAHFYCELAQQAWLEGSFEQAQKYLKKAQNTQKSTVRASILQGNLYSSIGDYKEALRAYQKVHQQDPAFLSEVVASMGRCYQKLNNTEGMIRYLQNQLQARPALHVVLTFSDWLQEQQGSQAAWQYVIEYLRKNPSIRGLNHILQLNISAASGKMREDLQHLQEVVDRILTKNPTYRCENCGLSGRVLQWLCPSCQQWETMRPISGLELT